MFDTVGIVGHPVRHSFSPLLHQAWFKDENLPFTYERWDVLPARLSAFFGWAKAERLRGFNVTVPHKEKMVKLLNSCSRQAQVVGAVNTVIRRGSLFHGENTDVSGFLESCRECGQDPRGKRILLVGAGGAARAVAVALARSGVWDLVIANRRLGRLKRLAKDLAGFKKLRVLTHRLQEGELAGFEGSPDWIINATSVGLHPGDGLPLNAKYIREGQFVMDLIYHRPTALLKMAQRKGAIASDGLGMLLHQAAEAFRLWTGVNPSLELGRKILRGTKERS